MAKRKGLSFDEKREKLLKIFHTSKDVFNLRDVEKLGAKAGIVEKTVKEILDSLIADDLVEVEKIGAGNFFWSLPSRTTISIKKKIENYKDSIDKGKETQSLLKQQINTALEERPDTTERNELLGKYEALKSNLQSITTELKEFEKFDPKRISILKSECDKMKLKANLWTDNIFAIISWLQKKQIGTSQSQLFKMFEIPEEFDNIS